jgi:hypothetical protein
MSLLNLEGNNVRKLDMRESTYPNLQRLALSNNRIEEIVTVQHKALRILELSKLRGLFRELWDTGVGGEDVEGAGVGGAGCGGECHW